jgi:hypothetical protein
MLLFSFCFALDQKQHNCLSPPTLIILLGPLRLFCFLFEDNAILTHYVIEAQLQVVLNRLKNVTSRMLLKKWHWRWEQVCWVHYCS